MPNKNVYGYTLRDDYDRIVYVGNTDNPRARVAEHEFEGKDFDELVVETGPMTRQSAQRWESRRLKSYRDFVGRNPIYNKTNSGGFHMRGRRPISQRDLNPWLRW